MKFSLKGLETVCSLYPKYNAPCVFQTALHLGAEAAAGCHKGPIEGHVTCPAPHHSRHVRGETEDLQPAPKVGQRQPAGQERTFSALILAGDRIVQEDHLLW